MTQHLKLYSAVGLIEHESILREMQIENMNASRPEDVIEILNKIPDKEAFNNELQKLIFDSILANWSCLDLPAKLRKIGRDVRRHADLAAYIVDLSRSWGSRSD